MTKIILKFTGGRIQEAVIQLSDIRFMERYEEVAVIASDAGVQYWGVENYEEIKAAWLENGTSESD